MKTGGMRISSQRMQHQNRVGPLLIELPIRFISYRDRSQLLPAFEDQRIRRLSKFKMLRLYDPH